MKKNENTLLWGMDLGGTKIEGAIIDSNTRTILYRQRVPTGADKGYAHVLGQIAGLLSSLQDASGLSTNKLGIATPGTTDPGSGLLKNCNAVCLNGMPFRADLENMLGIRVEVANDANCFALAETQYGAVRQHVPKAGVVFGIILGTGVGGGIVCRGEIWPGAHGIAGEWGHNPLMEEGMPCYCGRSGCNETVFSGPALERYYAKLSGQPRPMAEISHLAEQKADPTAMQTLDYFLENLGKALASVVNVLDPDAVVIGGGLSHIQALYHDLRPRVQKHVFNPMWSAPVLKPLLGDSAGVYGAAELLSEKHHSN
jgi:fructokinase